ncbi:MAG: DUF881 domain-containing protein [Patescibacteria group bacterium]
MPRKDKAKKVAGQLLITAICVLFGIIIAAQFHSIPDRVTNPVAPYASLKSTKDDLYQEQNELKDEIASLRMTIQRTQEETQSSILNKDQTDLLNKKKAAAGLTKLNGAGVIISLDDSKLTPASEDSIVHASDVRDIFSLLWSSGAEGISINDQRVVETTAVDCIVNTILINNVRITTPIRVEAVGDQKKMYDKISNSENLHDLYQRKANKGIIFNSSLNSDITLPLFNGLLDLNTQ